MVNTVDFILDCEVFSDLHFLKVPRKARKPQILYCVKPKKPSRCISMGFIGHRLHPLWRKVGDRGLKIKNDLGG